LRGEAAAADARGHPGVSRLRGRIRQPTRARSCRYGI
jgi:hypothetical protein